MPARNTTFYSIFLILLDAFLLMSVFVAAYILRVQHDPRPLLAPVYAAEYFFSFLVVVPIWVLIFASLGLYSARVYTRRLAEWSKIILGTFIGVLLIIGYEYITETHLLPARLVAVYAFFGALAALILGRELFRVGRSLLFYFGRGVSRVLIVGNSGATKDIMASLANTQRSGYQIVAFAGPKNLVPSGITLEHFSTVESALKEIDRLHVTTIIQTDLYDSSERNQRILGAAQTHHISYNFIPGETEFYTGKNTTDVFLGYPMISVSQTPLIGWGAIVKSVFDRIVALLLVVLLFPVYLILIVLQKLFNPGPVFYRSQRLSRFSEPITLIKFRSMGAQYGKKDAAIEFKEMDRHDLAEEYSKHRKVTDDPRVTGFGRFLRDTSLDELPQLFNVLRGELSMVGPRPILPQETTFSPSRTALLHSVKSGVTGLWQVSGRSNLSFEERIELELYYAQNWSFWLDIKILFKTIGVVIRRQGAK